MMYYNSNKRQVLKMFDALVPREGIVVFPKLLDPNIVYPFQLFHRKKTIHRRIVARPRSTPIAVSLPRRASKVALSLSFTTAFPDLLVAYKVPPPPPPGDH